MEQYLIPGVEPTEEEWDTCRYPGMAYGRDLETIHAILSAAHVLPSEVEQFSNFEAPCVRSGARMHIHGTEWVSPDALGPVSRCLRYQWTEDEIELFGAAVAVGLLPVCLLKEFQYDSPWLTYRGSIHPVRRYVGDRFHFQGTLVPYRWNAQRPDSRYSIHIRTARYCRFPRSIDGLTVAQPPAAIDPVIWADTMRIAKPRRNARQYRAPYRRQLAKISRETCALLTAPELPRELLMRIVAWWIVPGARSYIRRAGKRQQADLFDAAESHASAAFEVTIQGDLFELTDAPTSVALSVDPDTSAVALAAARHPACPPDWRTAILEAVAWNGGPIELAALATGRKPDPLLASWARDTMIRHMLSLKLHPLRWLALRSPACPVEELVAATSSVSWLDRLAVATHQRTPMEALIPLCRDRNRPVRMTACRRRREAAEAAVEDPW